MLTTQRRKGTIVKEMAAFVQDQNLECDVMWWENRVQVIQEWLKANPLRIGVPDDGTIDTITFQISRGNRHVHTRPKAWRHIVAELHGIPGVCERFTGTATPSVDEDNVVHEEFESNNREEASPLPPSTHELHQQVELTSSPLRGKLRASKLKHPPSDDSAETPNQVDDHQEKPQHVETHKAPEVEKKSLSQMSMMERQQEWLRKKAEKAAAEKLRQQEEAEKELTFQPALRKQTTRPSSQPQSTPQPVDQPAVKTRAKSAGRHRSQKHDKATAKTSSSLLDAVKSELAASSVKPKSPREKHEAAPTPPLKVEQVSGTDATVASIAKVLENVGKIETVKPTVVPPVVSAYDRPFQFDSGSNETKARFQLQDPSKFDLTSMYRKKDKYARRDGVSLQMGRRDDTREEQIIAILFDREHFPSEEVAKEWYMDHKQRLLSYM
ncbi:hypothetical protein AeMF1_010048 [Aphanomyces euteiches]|nr:hypothetical protein AeMF1_010048 [Aphanomyces euteiches]KAH9190078.1 hypothetical protein AeNC1_007941 [Aphanomyces euteiches]